MMTTHSPRSTPDRPSSPPESLALNFLLGLALGITFLALAATGYMFFHRTPVVEVGQLARIGGVTLRVARTGWMTNEHNHAEDESPAPAGDALPAEVQQLAEARNLEIEAATAEGQVFPMPASMMPDLPDDGYRRLKVEFTMENVGNQPVFFGPAEFRLHAAAGGEWSPRAVTTFQAGTLFGGQRVDAVFFFDVPQEEESDLYLTWMRDGRQFRIPVEGLYDDLR
ncbi:MAG: DUF4352 domain-containing protein [Caldilineae bacterium]|nr:MAG: DUF4352 domain-containing protein [Caldilineae bacterium]